MMEMRIPLSSPDIAESDIEAVTAVLRTPRLSIGPKMAEFEEAVAGYVGAAHGVAVSSGTAGLHLGLLALGIGEGDEVILPSFTFLAAAHAVLYVRARPVFVDIDRESLNLDPARIERAVTPRSRAILAVHTFGRPAAMGPILEIARRHGLAVIEDACEAIGAEYRGRRAGGMGDIGVFGFYPNKPVTTGEGGMVATSRPDLAAAMRALRNQGRRESDGWLDHELLGYNYRLSEINCALGVAQMRRLDAILDRRAQLANKYCERLRDVPGVTLPALTMADGRVCWFVFVIRVAHRDAVCRRMAARGIGCARYFAPVHRQPLYAPYAGADLPVTDEAAACTLALPFFNGLTDSQIDEVCDCLRKT